MIAMHMLLDLFCYSVIVILSTFFCSLKEQLGRGQFGIVHRGIWRDEPEVGDKEITEVAVKSMENGAILEERVKFLQEAAIMGQFKHPYILQVLGILTGDNVSSICGMYRLSRYMMSYICMT